MSDVKQFIVNPFLCFGFLLLSGTIQVLPLIGFCHFIYMPMVDLKQTVIVLVCLLIWRMIKYSLINNSLSLLNYY